MASRKKFFSKRKEQRRKKKETPIEHRGFFFIRICVKDRSGSPKVERERNRTAIAESLTAAEVWSRWHALIYSRIIFFWYVFDGVMI